MKTRSSRSMPGSTASSSPTMAGASKTAQRHHRRAAGNRRGGRPRCRCWSTADFGAARHRQGAGARRAGRMHRPALFVGARRFRASRRRTRAGDSARRNPRRHAAARRAHDQGHHAGDGAAGLARPSIDSSRLAEQVRTRPAPRPRRQRSPRTRDRKESNRPQQSVSCSRHCSLPWRSQTDCFHSGRVAPIGGTRLALDQFLTREIHS